MGCSEHGPSSLKPGGEQPGLTFSLPLSVFSPPCLFGEGPTSLWAISILMHPVSFQCPRCQMFAIQPTLSGHPCLLPELFFACDDLEKVERRVLAPSRYEQTLISPRLSPCLQPRTVATTRWEPNGCLSRLCTHFIKTRLRQGERCVSFHALAVTWEELYFSPFRKHETETEKFSISSTAI